ncbi:MATE family efflux transporter [Alkalibaculum sp. M08DMB]|uniref:Multidrug export protein MepA n=1 Tax=Alkalibaculum sporogenes TaxID=2655001 RepID=A0A6A7K7S9_9FIRM|nr:MATE family efflux transporter [Alkalibaculum sporogenes]MPW25539.1 MATE family efflux transporter [Alkalibaculum sporogenes]
MTKLNKNKPIKNNNDNRMDILESMPIKKAIWALAIPTMLAMLIQVIYNMTDTFFIGKLNEPNMVAAISISFPIFMIVQAFGNIFAIGGASLISRLLGKGEVEQANHAGAIAFWTAFSVCAVVAILGLIFTEPILLFCGASENTIGYASSYLRIMLIGGLFIGMQMAMGGLLRSEGATKESMVGMMTGSIINIVLDPIFILFLNMGVAGAAWATTIGNMFAFLYFVNFYMKKKGIISISPKLFSFDKKIYADIFKIGIPASLGMILMSVGMAVGNVFAASFGDDVVAANGIVMRVGNIAIMLAMGLAQGCQPLMGYNYGAKKYDRLLETIKRSSLISTIMCCFFAAIYFVFANVWIKIFINDVTVVNLGVKIMRVFVLGMPFIGIQMILMIMFQSLGRSVESLVLSLGRQGFFFIPALIIFSNLWGFDGFIFALPFADIATSLLSISLFIILRKKLHLSRDALIRDEERSYIDDQLLDNN